MHLSELGDDVRNIRVAAVNKLAEEATPTDASLFTPKPPGIYEIEQSITIRPLELDGAVDCAGFPAKVMAVSETHSLQLGRVELEGIIDPYVLLFVSIGPFVV
ncbi:hypothetical protein N7474_001781 [Penicillium riverlandense]|uniref:uncharacterized protein n=1 Tax=Penicillium riverlandense TaxID=1903569 RepID=UPI00254788D9|nr:uncharacterized protein N7474_001781 [Penicillium riverlandense]KAJ5833470.1 hypothetical protein N7474_001781 [Penicillium riverlandense]